MARSACTDYERLLARPGRSSTVSRRVDDGASEVALARERSGHLGLSPSESGSENYVGDGHVSTSLLTIDLTNDGDVPLLGRFVELGSGRVEGCFAPRVDFEDVDVGFEEVGELAGGSEDGPL